MEFMFDQKVMVNLVHNLIFSFLKGGGIKGIFFSLLAFLSFEKLDLDKATEVSRP